MPICNQCSVFEENEDVEGWRAGRSVAYCEACDTELKRATQGLTLSEEQSIGSFRSNEKTGKNILPRYHKHIYLLFLAFDTMCVINAHARSNRQMHGGIQCI